MRYISTRGGGEPQPFKDVLLQGLAPDGGLYMPEAYPRVSSDLPSDMSYQEIAFAVLELFMTDIPFGHLQDLINKTYTKDVFGSDEIVPVTTLERDFALMHLANGPTLAFKDLALQFLGNAVEYVLAERGQKLNILAATSGDTGSAAEEAFMEREGVRVFMLSPDGRMSPFQRQQMYTNTAPNVINMAVNGTFDDCQATVKAVNADLDFKSRYSLGAVNSINVARILAQMVYYVSTYLKVTRARGRRVTFVVPTGNFGNVLAAYFVARMGFNIRIIVATNENDVLDEGLRTGIYRVRKDKEVKKTLSPSMDIAAASNFERLLFDFADRDVVKTRVLMKELRERGSINIQSLLRTPGAAIFYSDRATDDEVIDTIRTVYTKYKIIIDPHTAVSMAVALRHCGRYHGPVVVAETAQPAKFADTIRAALGFDSPIPERFANLANLPERVIQIDPDPDAVKKIIRTHAPAS